MEHEKIKEKLLMNLDDMMQELLEDTGVDWYVEMTEPMKNIYDSLEEAYNTVKQQL